MNYYRLISTMSRGGGSTSYLLDDYGSAVVGYSLRKIESTYSGNVIRVRRSSDNVEQDIGLNGDSLDTTSLLSFIGANDGHVVSWYDQSGNSRTITQSTATNQPKIVSSGSLIVASNGLPIIQTDGADFLNGSGWLNPASGYTLTTVIDVPNLTQNQCFFSAGLGNQNQHYVSRTASGTDRYYDTSANLTASKLSIGTHLISIYDSGSTTSNAWEDGVHSFVNFTSLNAVGNGVTLFQRQAGSASQNGVGIQEIVQFNSDLTSQISDVNTDINNYYSIY